MELAHRNEITSLWVRVRDGELIFATTRLEHWTPQRSDKPGTGRQMVKDSTMPEENQSVYDLVGGEVALTRAGRCFYRGGVDLGNHAPIMLEAGFGG
jgi:hypothetical protein